MNIKNYYIKNNYQPIIILSKIHHFLSHCQIGVSPTGSIIYVVCSMSKNSYLDNVPFAINPIFLIQPNLDESAQEKSFEYDLSNALSLLNKNVSHH